MALKTLSGFFYHNTTQFLGALNDNLYKLLLIFFLIDLQGVAATPKILALSGAIFVIPFLLFSIPSGTLADKISKQRIIIFTKFLEIITVSIGIVGFAIDSPLLGYTGLFLLATQSAIFGPSKYGIIPEIVSQDDIPKANGYLSSFTFLAIIVGTFLGSFLTQFTDRHFVFAALFCILISAAGIFTSLKIPKTPAVGSKKPIDWLFIREIPPTLKKAKQTNHLLLAIFGSGYFLFVGAFTQLNIIPFSINCLGLSDVQGGYLFLVTAFGIGAGSIIAGKVSGHHVELGLVPIGIFGISLCFLSLGFCAGNLWATVIVVFTIGLFGGLFLVPQDSYIQVASPDDWRGQNVAVNNFGAFLWVLIASALIYIFDDLLGLPASKGFMIIGLISLSLTGVFIYFLGDSLLLFFAKLFSHPKDDAFTQVDTIAKDSGALIITDDWKSTFTLLAYRKHPVILASSSNSNNLFKKIILRWTNILPLKLNSNTQMLSDDSKFTLELFLKKGFLIIWKSQQPISPLDITHFPSYQMHLTSTNDSQIELLPISTKK